MQPNIRANGVITSVIRKITAIQFNSEKSIEFASITSLVVRLIALASSYSIDTLYDDLAWESISNLRSVKNAWSAQVSMKKAEDCSPALNCKPI